MAPHFHYYSIHLSEADNENLFNVRTKTVDETCGSCLRSLCFLHLLQWFSPSIDLNVFLSVHPFVLIHLWSSCCVKGAKGLPRGAFSGIWFQWHFCTVTNRVCVSVCFWLRIKWLWEDAVGSQRAGRHMSVNSLHPAAVHELKSFFSSSSPKQLVS